MIFFPFQRWKTVSNDILLLYYILTANFICEIQSSHMFSAGVERGEGVAANQFKNLPQFNLIHKIKNILTISSILAWHFCFIVTPYQWQAMLMSETVTLDRLGFTVHESGNSLKLTNSFKMLLGILYNYFILVNY